MERMISKSQFKPKALEYFRLIEENGDTLIITDRGKPVLKVVPYTANTEEQLKILRGSVLQYDNPTEPVAIEDWDTLR